MSPLSKKFPLPVTMPQEQLGKETGLYTHTTNFWWQVVLNPKSCLKFWFCSSHETASQCESEICPHCADSGSM